MKNIIFDVGSYDGKEFEFQYKNDPETVVYAFEPQPLMAQEIRERTAGYPNFHLIEAAVANYAGRTRLNLAGGGRGGMSSILNYSKSEETKAAWGEKRFDVDVEVDVMTLASFIEANKIPYITYLHIDAQGSDVDVLNSLGRHKRIVQYGCLEVSVVQLYAAGSNSANAVRRWFQRNDWDYMTARLKRLNELANGLADRKADFGYFLQEKEENWLFHNPNFKENKYD